MGSPLFDINPKEKDIPEHSEVEEVSDDYYNGDVSTEQAQKDAQAELDDYDKNYKSEHPNLLSDISDTTVKMMFGDSWNGEYSNMNKLVQSAAENLAWQMSMYSSLSEYLTSAENKLTDEVMTKSGLYQLKNGALNVQNSYNELKSAFTNFGNMPITDSSNVLWSADNVLANLENTTSTLMNMEGQINDVVDFIQKHHDMSDLPFADMIEKQYERITDMISQQNLSNLLDSFPQSVMNKFMDCDIVQNLYTMPKKLYQKLTGIATTLASIEAPTNLSTVLSIIKTLRGAVAQMQDVQRMVSEGASQITAFKSNLQSGNYIGLFQQIKGACKFTEKTSQFAPKYSYNQAFETEGGHIFETDNTPGKERLHVQHCSGTDMEMSPSGDITSKIKNDFQMVVDNNSESHTKGNQLMLVDGEAELESKTMKLTAKDNMDVSSTSMTVTTDNLSMLSENAIINSNGNVTIAGNSGASVSSVGPVFLTSKSMVMIDAPSIIIGKQATTALVSIAGANLYTNGLNTLITSAITKLSAPLNLIGDGVINLKGLVTIN